MINKTGLLFLLCLLTGCGDNAAPPPVKSDSPVQASFEITEGFPVIVPLQLDGIDYSFIFDTGCSVTSFNIKHKDKLGKYLESQTSTGANWQKIPIDFHEITAGHKFKMGDINLVGKVGLMDYNHFGDWVEKHDGLLGIDILENFIVQLDFENNRLLLLKPDTNPAVEWGTPFDLEFSGGTPHLHVRLTENVSELFMIDTAAAMVYLTQDKFEKLFHELHPDAKYTKRPITPETRSLKQVTIKDFKLGDIVYEKFHVTENARSFLGMDFLREHKLVTLDLKNNKLYLNKKSRVIEQDANR